ncbi:SLC13 family permease [Nocardioides sp. cx-173]|uniref:SLC13 family permease n=1 Tax=Nocardioides sp. cx-173 TaxID=2898796 RepID=UPI001E2C615F|nr:SLC13 family permease [Nocardioides sp. cx-173]MCD4525560.1 arsenic transporter [Nocardioides sp. cx-173]UGB42704.1 arsenic transporter [Nocardioides sp. cx-173]
MPTLAQLSAELVAVAALLTLLVTAYRHPSGRVEALVAVVATGAVLATGLVPLDRAGEALRHLAPVVAFLATILVVADVCARAGLFAALGRLLRPGPDRAHGPRRLFTAAFLVAAAVTAVLSLDATVVLLTPVVVGAAVAIGTSPTPGAYACLRMANSASLLLPVSNLTNLLAMPHLDLTFAGFALTMAPVLAAVLVVEYVALRVVFRRELSTPVSDGGEVGAPAMEPFPVAVVALMLAGFAVTSPLGLEPYAVSSVAALVLVGWGRRRRLVGAREVLRAAHPGFACFVLALGVVVAAISEGFLGDLVARALPSSTTLGALALIAALATVLANLLTNLSATLLLVPLLAPLGDTAVLAALLGLNIGAGLTYSGSLANLLWARHLGRYGERPDLRRFHRVSLALTPLSLAAAVAALWLAT